MTVETRALLRALPTLAGIAPPLDLEAFPDDPVALFLDWLDIARQAGAAEPHAMTLSTVDADGVPDARVLVLKDVDERGWAFASTRSSVKGGQLGDEPHAALTFWWQPVVRSVRIRGRVVEASGDESLADLHARSAAAQDGVEAGDWRLWRVVPDRVEFWQGAPDRRHTRIVFTRRQGGWRCDV
ncbi:pyridoxamine 5'-phosphate oxidase [Microbacterium sp. W4I4]|uniref:pyridoxine/pyridoxamine 5'-phosphate oxidase n=1 Tax=Microbacterium sp. W4I4 TaxID=3042295 RepID=UPI00278982A4|nr:pyridoxamine 5'-phosphate oxidase family protein [Microbacterium sp. W4I4]MDQ0613428.1 pyridoxamine 5'-phosphate oxidase [Microbacterium sp. W4I4]